MSQTLKTFILLAGGIAGAVLGYYYNSKEWQNIAIGALIGSFVTNWIIEMAEE